MRAAAEPDHGREPRARAGRPCPHVSTTSDPVTLLCWWCRRSCWRLLGVAVMVLELGALVLVVGFLVVLAVVALRQ